VERPISTAGKLERKYDWLGAATLYRDAVNLVSALEFLKKGEMQERIGHCLYRAAFQTDGLDEFRGRMRRALDAYTSARGLYAQLTSVQKVGRVFRCDAIASYLHFWLTADPSEQRRRLDDCLAWEAEALEAFSEAGNMVEYGRTYGTLPHVFWHACDSIWAKWPVGAWRGGAAAKGASARGDAARSAGPRGAHSAGAHSPRDSGGPPLRPREGPRPPDVAAVTAGRRDPAAARQHPAGDFPGYSQAHGDISHPEKNAYIFFPCTHL
jgi:hypothetical protein